jgi:hypothetical protein
MCLSSEECDERRHTHTHTRALDRSGAETTSLCSPARRLRISGGGFLAPLEEVLIDSAACCCWMRHCAPEIRPWKFASKTRVRFKAAKCWSPARRLLARSCSQLALRANSPKTAQLSVGAGRPRAAATPAQPDLLRQAQPAVAALGWHNPRRSSPWGAPSRSSTCESLDKHTGLRVKVLGLSGRSRGRRTGLSNWIVTVWSTEEDRKEGKRQIRALQRLMAGTEMTLASTRRSNPRSGTTCERQNECGKGKEANEAMRAENAGQRGVRAVADERDGQARPTVSSEQEQECAGAGRS